MNKEICHSDDGLWKVKAKYSIGKIITAFAIKHGARKLKMKIAQAVMETEMQDEHDQKRKIKKKFLISNFS